MKTGGRKRGTPNKKTVAVQEQMERLGFDPIKSMIEICNQAMTDKRATIFAKACFGHPSPSKRQKSRGN